MTTLYYDSLRYDVIKTALLLRGYEGAHVKKGNFYFRIVNWQFCLSLDKNIDSFVKFYIRVSTFRGQCITNRIFQIPTLPEFLFHHCPKFSVLFYRLIRTVKYKDEFLYKLSMEFLLFKKSRKELKNL